MSNKYIKEINNRIKKEGIEVFREITNYDYFENSKQLFLLNKKNEVILYNLNNSEEIHKFKIDFEVKKMKISPDGKLLAFLTKLDKKRKK